MIEKEAEEILRKEAMEDYKAKKKAELDAQKAEEEAKAKKEEAEMEKDKSNLGPDGKPLSK